MCNFTLCEMLLALNDYVAMLRLVLLELYYRSYHSTHLQEVRTVKLNNIVCIFNKSKPSSTIHVNLTPGASLRQLNPIWPWWVSWNLIAYSHRNQKRHIRYRSIEDIYMSCSTNDHVGTLRTTFTCWWKEHYTCLRSFRSALSLECSFTKNIKQRRCVKRLR